MDPFCSTRMLKNARFLQSPLVGFFLGEEPLEGFPSLLPQRILMRLNKLTAEEVRIEGLAKALSRSKVPTPGATAAAPLFSGTLKFVQTTFSTGGTDFSVPDSDMKVAVEYAIKSAVPISEYASQYGPNSLSVTGGTIPFSASVTNGTYNDTILSRWADELAKSLGLGPDSCLAFLNPKGVVNSDADISKGILGYHEVSSSGVPYIFVNVTGEGLTLADRAELYALALSHEIAEMTVDPRADGSNAEVSDSCSGNCNTDHRNYFDSNGDWLGGSATPGYYFFTAGVATPAAVAQCPAPAAACSYPPPKPRGA